MLYKLKLIIVHKIKTHRASYLLASCVCLVSERVQLKWADVSVGRMGRKAQLRRQKIKRTHVGSHLALPDPSPADPLPCAAVTQAHSGERAPPPVGTLNLVTQTYLYEHQKLLNFKSEDDSPTFLINTDM